MCIRFGAMDFYCTTMIVFTYINVYLEINLLSLAGGLFSLTPLSMFVTGHRGCYCVLCAYNNVNILNFCAFFHSTVII